MLQGFAQQNASVDVYRIYRTALELLRNEKYAAAAEQFRLVEHSRVSTASQTDFESKLSLVKENAQYYEALCALQLDNDDAENQLLRFTKEHPENPNTKLALFQIGNYYFNQEKYIESILWYDKVTAGELSGIDYTMYKFRKGYAFFAIKNYKNAQPLFGEVKAKHSIYTDDAYYYFAYIAYLNKDYTTALVNFEKLKDNKKYQSSYPFYITSVYFLNQRYDDVIAYAVPILSSSVQLHQTEMYRLVAASYFAKANYPVAVDYYNRFENDDLGKTQNNQDTYQAGYADYQTGDYPKAIKELEKLVEQKDEYSQSGNYTLGNAFLKTGNKQSARSAFFVASKLSFDPQIEEDALFEYSKLSYELDFNNEALEGTRLYLSRYPNSAKLNQVKTLLAEELLNSHNYRDAIDILEPIPDKNEGAQEAYQKVTYYRGLEFYNERAFENAIGVFLRSLNFPVNKKIETLTTYWMAESMYEVRKYGEAVENFDKFLAMPDAKNTTVYNYANYALAYAAFGANQYKKAAGAYETFLNGEEKDTNTVIDATTRLADCYFVLKDYGKASVLYNKIINNHNKGEDYALFQIGMIEGLQGSYDTKIGTMADVLAKYPNSNYADDAAFEIAYTDFLKGQGEAAKNGLNEMIVKYPHSSYIPRALVTIGLIEYNDSKDDLAIESFKRVVADYPSTDEAKQALKQIEKIYTDKGDAQTFITYAATTPIGNYTSAQQESIMYTAANNLYLANKWDGTVAAVNAYFDRFPKPIYDKQSRFIRAQSLVNLNRLEDAVPDYMKILNDWTSAYTEKSLISMSKIYISEKKYNEAVVFLKRLETNSEYKADYNFAISNLMQCYAEMEMPDDALKYVGLVRENNTSAEEDKFRAGLYAGKAYLQKADTTSALKELTDVVASTRTVTAAEAKYNIAWVQYRKKNYKGSQKTCFDLINKLSNYDYWVAKTYVLLARDYSALKDDFQAKATLQSIIDNYQTDDDVLPEARQIMQSIDKSTGAIKDTSKVNKQ